MLLTFDIVSLVDSIAATPASLKTISYNLVKNIFEKPYDEIVSDDQLELYLKTMILYSCTETSISFSEALFKYVKMTDEIIKKNLPDDNTTIFKTIELKPILTFEVFIQITKLYLYIYCLVFNQTFRELFKEISRMANC